jgi:hypothetical protein
MPHLPLKYLKIFLIVGGWYEIQYTKQGHLYMNEIGGISIFYACSSLLLYTRIEM